MLSIKELSGMNMKELQAELDKSQKALLEMKMNISQGEVKKVSDVKKTRKYIAQMKTLQTQINKEEAMKAKETKAETKEEKA